MTAEPVSGYEFESYVVKDSEGNDVNVHDSGTFYMPLGAVTVSATFQAKANEFNVSWFKKYPEAIWSRVDGVADEGHYGYYMVRVLDADGVSPLTDWNQQVYYETDFDLEGLIAEHGPGTYSIEVWAYDSDSNLIATRKSSPQTFHKLDFEFETLDAASSR